MFEGIKSMFSVNTAEKTLSAKQEREKVLENKLKTIAEGIFTAKMHQQLTNHTTIAHNLKLDKNSVLSKETLDKVSREKQAIAEFAEVSTNLTTVELKKALSIASNKFSKELANVQLDISQAMMAIAKGHNNRSIAFGRFAKSSLAIGGIGAIVTAALFAKGKIDLRQLKIAASAAAAVAGTAGISKLAENRSGAKALESYKKLIEKDEFVTFASVEKYFAPAVRKLVRAERTKSKESSKLLKEILTNSGLEKAKVAEQKPTEKQSFWKFW